MRDFYVGTEGALARKFNMHLIQRVVLFIIISSRKKKKNIKKNGNWLHEMKTEVVKNYCACIFKRIMVAIRLGNFVKFSTKFLRNISLFLLREQLHEVLKGSSS